MDTKNIKDEQIRKQIITASEVYRDKLAGRVFLYVYGESYFEVVFPTDRFRHLTGVNSSISAQEFYDKAKSSMLSAGQIFYDREHTYRGAKRKLPCLTMLPALTNNVVCVVKDMKTVTLTYKIGVTNLDFTIGLSENLDLEGNKINDWFLPRTLRVKDKAIESREVHAQLIRVGAEIHNHRITETFATEQPVGIGMLPQIVNPGNIGTVHYIHSSLIYFVTNQEYMDFSL